MRLILTIENEESLPNGVPASVSLGCSGGLDIGRGASQDWCLPDPSRFISGKHCEVRTRDNSYWLYDISANGTYLNASTSRLQAPHRLQHGDRVMIGTYVIAVAIEQGGEPAAQPEPFARASMVEAVPVAAQDWLSLPTEPVPSATGDMRVLEEQLWHEPTSPPQQAWHEPTSPPPPQQAWHEPAPPPPPRQSWDEPASPPQQTRHEPAPPPPPRQSWHEPTSPPLEARHEPAPPPQQARHEPAPVELGANGDEFLRRFAAGAGVPEQIFARRDSLEFAEELGALLRLTTENLTQLLRARSDVGRTAGVSSQTTVQALDNNPLKFSPSAEDALRIMFGPRTRGFLDARRAIEGAFMDLKTHQVYTFAAMQQAVRMLVEDFDPKAIDEAAGPDHGLGSLLGSRKARLWDIYAARWRAQTLRHDDGLAGAFLRYFGQCFDAAKEANMH